MKNFVPIVLRPSEPKVQFYIAENFAENYLGKIANPVPHYYFKSKFRGLDKSFQKLNERFEIKDEHKGAIVFLSEDDVVVYMGCGYIHVWDARKPYPAPGSPGDFEVEKVKFLNWFKNVFPN